ncbi:MAG: hypothetical protein NVSMB25_14190 [Thermoleophilaceae bacterium]
MRTGRNRPGGELPTGYVIAVTRLNSAHGAQGKGRPDLDGGNRGRASGGRRREDAAHARGTGGRRDPHG